MNEHPAVLYVDDDARSRKLMQMLLKGRMNLAHLTIFEDSSDFLARVEALEPKPDIIFLDIHISPYNGFEMLEMLRQRDWTAKTPIVAITASVMNEEVNKLKSTGFNACLAKPIDLTSFPDVVNRILQGESIWRIDT